MLYARDEPAGFVTACPRAPRPGHRRARGRLGGEELKDRAFARTVNRADVYRGAEEIGVPLEDHLGFVILALTAAAPRLGLARP